MSSKWRTRSYYDIYTLLKKLVRLGCITQGSLVEITNQRFSLKYQTFWQLAAAFITNEGSSKLSKCLVFQRKSLVGDFHKRTLRYICLVISVFSMSAICYIRDVTWPTTCGIGEWPIDCFVTARYI